MGLVVSTNGTSTPMVMYATFSVLSIDLCHAAAILVREHRFRTSSFELTRMGTSSRGAKERFSVSRDSIWPLCDKSLLF